ncbi:hypothetical protein GQ55_5G363500 [Panicum hallii var. hallii]|uniref:Uncharacterized protein n=1 Tax=Panicum hallii var. hallii TaxID=1504633 RepID=A0A2T7DMH0_9POAL|nr:hypothetical protein GQ55_5G317900 [Panicum hallii var. hallii]PUZ56781.1 hypothetical protein GQ55_5G363500 [Panicum hallii var. hallii]
MGEGRTVDSIPESLSEEVFKQGVFDGLQLLENSEKNGVCEASGTYSGSCLDPATGKI